jgi:anthranilate synthase component 1
MNRAALVPSRDEFARYARDANLVPVFREILADLETPVSAFLKVARDGHAFLLESVEGGEKWGRYSFLGTQPAVIFTVRGDEVTIERPGSGRDALDGRPGEEARIERRRVADPFAALRELMVQYRPAPVPGLPRFHGGAVGYVGYDVVRYFERLPASLRSDLDVPDMCLLVPDVLLVFDAMTHTIKVIANVLLEEGADVQGAYDHAARQIDEVVARLAGGVVAPVAPPRDGVVEPRSNISPAEYCRIVERAKEYIRAGDIIQVVLAQRFEMPLRVAPFDIYRRLRVLNPSPYMFFLQLGEMALAGASPEVMVRVEGRGVAVRPIAGTRPRGADEATDAALARELLADPKERAEHIMLVDLGRNDVGRVARVGSVRVTEQMMIERYSHVMHLVSHVRGELAPGQNCFDAFRATFPAGTLTGAPKVRAMEIIEELERVRRGAYGGAVGYFGFSGNMDTCITIRTALAVGDRLYVQAGAGIVADSDPEFEHRECVNKAMAVLKAAQMAEGR